MPLPSIAPAIRLFRKLLGWGLLAASAVLLLIVWFAFVAKHGHLTVLTTMPVWIWSLAGMSAAAAACLGLQYKWVFLMPATWIAFTIAVADEAKTLWNGPHEEPVAGPSAKHEERPTFRVLTMNCASFAYGSPTEDIATWQPDIVLLQDAYPHQVRTIAKRLFGKAGFHTNCSRTSGIVSRWPILLQVALPGTRNHQVIIRMPGPLDVKVINLHLGSANTDLRFWKRSTWTNHRINHAKRIREIDAVAATLASQSTDPVSPVLLGGDFNAPATDVVHNHYSTHFQDSFLQAGSGWGNTYHRRFPILRIDYLYHNSHFKAVRSRTVESIHSDHRMVLADYVIQ